MSVLAKLLSDVLRVGKAPNRIKVDVPATLARAIECLGSGDGDHAHALCSIVLDVEPDNSRAHHLIGAILARRGEYDSAERSLRRALAVDPGRVDAWVDLGNVLQLSGVCDAALDCFTRALEIEPQDAPAAYGHSQTLVRIGREEEAIRELQRRVAPDYHPLLLRTLVALLAKHGRYEIAWSLCAQALASNADNAEAHSSIGFLALTKDQDPVRALVHFDRAVLSIDDDADLHSNRGIALQELGRIDEAVACYEKALSLDAQHRSARIHRALAFLQQAEYGRGWSEYENRRLADGWASPPDGVAEWQGEDLEGKAIYVYAEQGIGDEVLFASCLPDLIARARRVMVECDARLMAIFARSFPGIAVLDRAGRLGGAQGPARMGADRMAPIASLPRFFRTQLHSFPAQCYLRADQGAVVAMCSRLSSLPAERLKVGISWRGGTAKTWSNKRSMRPDELVPLLRTAGITWISLQHGNTCEELARLHADHGIDVQIFPDVLADFDQTAAFVSALDLVISVDNTIANLCGALGRPVWVAVPLSPDWRYGMQGESTPWFRSMRLFRQAAHGGWKDVIASITAELNLFREARQHAAAKA